MSSFKPIKVLDLCNKAPPSGSIANTSTALPLTFFDIHWLLLPPSHLPNLKRTLSSTLIHFYPLAGNLSWPHEPNQPMICYTKGNSVSFALVESNADFNHLSSNHPRNAIDLCPLVSHLPTFGPIVPMLAIQVTIFPNTRICIGVTHHKLICDGRGFIHFMKTWASISTLESSEPLPLLDMTFIKDHVGITKIFLYELDGFMGSQSMLGNRLRVMDIKLKPNIVRATFELNEETSRILKERFYPISRFGSKSNITRFVVAVDYRARLDPIIQETYFGNCVKSCSMNAEKSDLIKGGIPVAAQLMKFAVQEVEAKKRILKVLAAAGSPQFGLYKIDLGFGRPKKLEMASIDRTGAMFMKESSNLYGGIEFDLVLNRQEMDAFVSLFVDGFHGLRKEPLCHTPILHQLEWCDEPSMIQ
ncbi:hypothetical protein NE237_005039 [Protea cynaroides]|uniref:Uncharacterized protein n=1 Tax=Protea cynaroides TaxID=273540 RepID=A0A9Q0QU56_9MAGN|nr:hypothetical protein NE237_005039 [Protea cynaroides]